MSGQDRQSRLPDTLGVEWSVVIDESAPSGDLLPVLVRLLRGLARREMERQGQPAPAAAEEKEKGY